MPLSPVSPSSSPGFPGKKINKMPGWSRWALGVCALCVATIACSDKPSRKTVDRTVESPDQVDERNTDGGAGTPEAANYTPEEYARYKRHLHLGRAHADQRRFAEAVREFDQSLDVLPMDGRALSELGWAAFQAGDWQRARTANQDAVRVAKQPSVRAASLYNLGRLAEAVGDRQDAQARYRESLALRENEAVRKRLAGLPTSEPGARPSTASACPATTDLQALCACLSGAVGTGGRTALTPNSCQSESRDIPGVELLFVGDDTEERVYLIRKGPDGWSSIAQLGRVYDSHTEGIAEEFEVARFENRLIGERRVLWIEIAQTRTDEEARKRGQLAYRTQRLVVCPWPVDDRVALTCVLEVPLAERRETVRRGAANTGDERPQVRTVFAVDVDIGDDGRASVILTRGKKVPALEPLLGEHKLW